LGSAFDTIKEGEANCERTRHCQERMQREEHIQRKERRFRGMPPLQHQFSNKTTAGSLSADTNSLSGGYDHLYVYLHLYSHSRSPPPHYQRLDGRQRRSVSTSASASGSRSGSHGVDVMDPRELGVFDNSSGRDGNSAPNNSVHQGLDSMQLHYCMVDAAAELTMFHCERVRK
jgi:cysteine protease ATG4